MLTVLSSFLPNIDVKGIKTSLITSYCGHVPLKWHISMERRVV